MNEILIDLGIPAAVMSIFSAILVYFLKREFEKRDRLREEHNKKNEQLIYLAIQKIDSASVLAEATARAVQRIPDAKCNGDMKKALSDAEQMRQNAHEFMVREGIRNILDN